MDRQIALLKTKEMLEANGLKDWHARLSASLPCIGKCDYKTKTIWLNIHGVDTHPDIEVNDTISHEIAHAVVGHVHGHNDIWKAKAKELGALPQECTGVGLNEQVIDAVRSGHAIEVEIEETVVRTPKYKITQLGNVCSVCGKKAKEVSHEVTGTVKKTKLECGHYKFRTVPKATPYEEMISLNADSNCKHEWKLNRCTKCPANRLFKFQVEGARFIESNFGKAGVFDQQGLGKTIQALAYLKYHEEAFPVLFIVKSALKYQWMDEILKWLGPKYLPQVLNSGKELPFRGLKCYIMSYQNRSNLNAMIEKFKDMNLQTIIIDECQAIKNPDSNQTQKVRTLVKNVNKFIALSGTPWKNRGSEFFPVLNMLDATRFYSYKGFINRWVDFYYDGAKPKEGGIKNPQEFREFIKDIVIRRERSDVDVEFPDINRVKFHTELDEVTRTAYDEEVSDFVKWWNQIVIDGLEDAGANEMNAIARLQRMRHMLGLSKIPATVELMEEYLENTDDKGAIFLHHKDVGQILFNKIKELDVVKRERIPVLRITSDMDSMARTQVCQQFNQLKRVVLLGSQLASGEGLNLQTCPYLIQHERQWNPGNEEQVEDRFIRIGATVNKVTATYVHAENSIDTKFDELVERKRVFFHSTMNKGQKVEWNEKAMVKELIQSLIDSQKRKK